MKKIANKLLSELIKNSKRSDRELARILGISQPSVSRLRTKLANEGAIQEYTIIPDFSKLGFELFAISCVKVKALTKEVIEKAEKWVNKNPSIVLMAGANGMGKNGIIVSLHRNYTDYSRFTTEAEAFWSQDIEGYDTILVSLKGVVPKPFSLSSLSKALITSEE